jgi:hypothetical protein
VRLDPVTNETVLVPQDGDQEQENVFYFNAPEYSESTAYDAVIHLHNDDPFDSRFFYLHYQTDLPDGWRVNLNQGDLGVEVAPNSMVDIPVQIVSGVVTDTVGSVSVVDVSAAALKLLASDPDPNDRHPEDQVLGGVWVETRVVQDTILDCSVVKTAEGGIYVRCELDGLDHFFDPLIPPRLMAQGLQRQPDGG